MEDLSNRGFCFLWILNSQMNVGYECLNKWGYDVVDQITWIKTKNNKIHTSHGYYFLHSSETCLVGYKCSPGSSVDFISKVTNNIIFADVQKKSQKPEQIYTIIDLMMPGAKKMELFARNNNLRHGWFSLGNQLGENYNQWQNEVDCNKCGRQIEHGHFRYIIYIYIYIRYKSKQEANFDICDNCYQKEYSEDIKLLEYNNEESPIKNTSIHEMEGKRDTFQENDYFFRFRHNTESEVRHEYYKCNKCGTDPIWGIKFNCLICNDYDLCEICYDLWITQKFQQGDEETINLDNRLHPFNHNFGAIEVFNISCILYII